MKKLFLLIFLLSFYNINSTTFDGYVYDQDTSEPITEAVVTAGGIQIGDEYSDTTWVDTTDVNGYFFIDDLIQADDYTILASAINYISRDTLMETPPETYNFYLSRPTTGYLVETINEGLRHYEHNGEYWFRSDGEVYDNLTQNFFFDIDAENDTINALMTDIGAGTDQTDDDLEIRDKLAVLWLWMQDKCYCNFYDTLWIEADNYLIDHSDGHFYTISALASTFAQYGFIPWGTCTSRANIFVTLLYRTGVSKDIITMAECRTHLRYSQHMYLIINLFNRWYHFDPTHLYGVLPAADSFQSRPYYQTVTQDHTHLWKIFNIQGSSLSQIPITTFTKRNPELFIKNPPENTHTTSIEITLTGYADGTVVDSIIVQNLRYPVVSDSFTANAILSHDENNIEVSTVYSRSSECIDIFRDYYSIPYFSAEPTQGYAPLEVQFQDNTEIIGPFTVSSWAWDFNEDDIIDSYLSDPTFTYNINGTYSVKMMITILGTYDNVIRENVINVYDHYIEGNAYLTGESDHTGIIVELFSQSGSVPLNQIMTNSNGYYRLYLEPGSYYFKFSHPDFFSMFIYDVNVSGNEILDDTYLIPLSPLIIVPDYFMTIGNALDFAQNGNTIRVRPGIYNENLDLSGKSLTLESFYAVDPDTSYISGTVIEGNRGGSIITILLSESHIVIDGFTIANGNEVSGGGVYIGGIEAEVTLRNLRFINNTADNGGGLYCKNALLNAENITFNNNYAEFNGGAFYLDNIRSNQYSNITVLFNESGYSGAGYVVETDDISLDNLIIDSNTSGGPGGGLRLILCNGIEFTGLDVVNNNSDDSGGGLYLSSCDSNCFTDLNIMENTSLNSGGAMLLIDCDSLSITNARICSNQSIEGSAGAIKLQQSSGLFIYNAVICDNHVLNITGNGGAFYMNNYTSAWIINSTIQGNSTFGHGSAFYITGSSDLEIYNCIVADNYDAETVYANIGATTFASNYSDYFGNDEPLFHNCNDSLGVITGTNYNEDPCDAFSNIFLDPEFMTTEDFHLFFSSPCIEAGTPDTTGLHIPSLDLDGNLRIYGDIIDMGAYEFQGIVELPAPENIVIIITDTEVIISWDAVPHATSYQVYSSLTAFQGFSPEEGGNFSRNREIITWSKALDPEQQKKFYQVRAVLE